MNIVAIGGEPASGKTFVVNKLRELIPEVKVPFAFGKVKGLTNKGGSIYILGVYDGSTYEGGDKLSVAVSSDLKIMLRRLRNEEAVVYLEGYRLFTKSLCSRHKVEARLLRVLEEEAKSRHGKRGDFQTSKFLAKRRSEVDNLHLTYGFPWVDNNNEKQAEDTARWMASYANR